MPSKTFVLGAGFSADAGFPLVRDLRSDVPAWIEAEQHPSAKPHLTPHVHGYSQGQFYAGWDVVDPNRTIGFEEWMMALRDRLLSTHPHDPAHVFHRILRDACGRLLWQKHRALRDLPLAYRNFASWFHEHHSFGQPNAVVSFNWALLAEMALAGANVGWQYTFGRPGCPSSNPMVRSIGAII